MNIETVVGTHITENVEKAVPFFGVTNMETSLRYYIDGLGFEMKNKWVVDGLRGGLEVLFTAEIAEKGRRDRRELPSTYVDV